MDNRIRDGKGLVYSVSHSWSHSWRAEGHTMNDQANDSTQSPHHHMQSPHSEKASGAARPTEYLICQGSVRTQQFTIRHFVRHRSLVVHLSG